MSGDRPLRVAVVGVGHLGRFHARIYHDNPRAELVCIADVDEAHARSLADELGCDAVGDMGDLPSDLDAVSVVVPTSHHVAVAVPLLERGIACLVEKPLAPKAEDAREILAARDRGGATLAVGHVERFQPGVRRLKELGHEPRFIECHRLTKFSFRSMDVGVVHDRMIHDLDLVLHLVDSPVASLDASGGVILTQGEDLASVRLVFENGARANVTASRVSLQPMRRFRTFSGDGYVSLDFAENHGILVRKGGEWDAGLSDLRTLDPRTLAGREEFVLGGMLDVHPLELENEERPLQAELDSFLVSVASGTPPEVTGEDGFAALALADHIAAEIHAQSW